MKIKITNKEAIDTGMALVLICLILDYFLTLPNINLFAMVLLITSMTIPYLLKPFAVVWFGLSRFLGGISSKIILSLIFYSIFTPIGLFVKLINRNPLNLGSFKKGSDSLFITRNYTFSAKDLAQPY